MILPVAAIILTLPNRQKYLARALDCLKKQTYTDSPIYPILQPAIPGVSIGTLRNAANLTASLLGAGVIIHWDDDDWSAPNRIQSQLADLQMPLVQAVGYNRMLFWDSVKSKAWLYANPHPRYALGTSLCYWTSTWQKFHFAGLQTGEDHDWVKRVRPHAAKHQQPIIVAELHASNTSSRVDPNAEEWKRQEIADNWCRERMKL